SCCDIHGAVTYHPRQLGINSEVIQRAEQHARFWFSTTALAFEVVRTKVNPVDRGTVLAELLHQFSMDAFQFCDSDPIFRYSSLIRNHNDSIRRLVEISYCLDDAREER